MTDAIIHRGPDEDGFLERSGLSLGSRRLSIIGLADGRQPISNEDGSIWVGFNGELFDYPEKRAELEAKGHVFRTSTDTELLPHLWEEYGIDMFEHLRGQFAFALWNEPQRELILARDRMGICPLFWTQRRTSDGSELLLFASEIKALLASGLVPAETDVDGGLNHVFSFFALPGPATCFAGINSLLPGRYLRLRLDRSQPLPIDHGQPYWEPGFPDLGSERDPSTSDERVVTEFEELMLDAVSKRLRAEVPVASYLSGGIDSSMIVALASKVLGRPIPTFTVGVKSAGLDEQSEAEATARYLGCQSVVVECRDQHLRETYPELIGAAEMPVIDTAAAPMLGLARSVRQHGYKVTLSGEGPDEWMAGYPWFKIHRALSYLDVFPRLNLSLRLRVLASKLTGQPRLPAPIMDRSLDAMGGYNAWCDVYALMISAKLRFFHPDVRARILNRVPAEEIQLTPALKRWHPFHRGLYFGGRVMLTGHLLASKGDRLAMHSSVEARYPFLDDKVWAFLASLHPNWKLKGFHDKYLLRRLARRWLPSEVVNRRKAMFRAPMDAFHLKPQPGEQSSWIEQVLSRESLHKTGYFDADMVTYWRENVFRLRRTFRRTSIEMGLMAVTATQLWHQLYIRGDLADLGMAHERRQISQNGAA